MIMQESNPRIRVQRVMAEQHSKGWRRIAGDLVRLLSTLVTVEDAPAEAQHSPAPARRNPATGLLMVGGIGGVDTGGHRYGQSVSIQRTQKR
jgi:hypothetical protein